MGNMDLYPGTLFDILHNSKKIIKLKEFLFLHVCTK